MIDGLALAETTPGPLILVLTFVGYYATHQRPGALPPLLAGTLGAIFVTWVTFVPSFIWIFLDAPYVERAAEPVSFDHVGDGHSGGRGSHRESCPLVRVACAVPERDGRQAWLRDLGLAGLAQRRPCRHRLAAIGLSLIASLALLRWRINLVKVLLATGALGYLAHATIG